MARTQRAIPQVSGAGRRTDARQRRWVLTFTPEEGMRFIWPKMKGLTAKRLQEELNKQLAEPLPNLPV